MKRMHRWWLEFNVRCSSAARVQVTQMMRAILLASAMVALL